jgi:hypothetical protein
MGHDIHFLKRLERVSLPQVELAMSLYNDPQLLSFVLGRARVPEAAEAVAISLGDPKGGPELGPFLIVTPTGRFVTCLGEGMRPAQGTPLIKRQHLDVIIEKAEDLRGRFEQAYKVAGNKGRVHQLLKRIYTAADELSREEFIALSAWRPLMGQEFLRQLVDALVYLDRARAILRKLDKPPRQYHDALHEYWNVFWAAGHLALLLGEDVHELLASLLGGPDLFFTEGITLSYGLVWQGFTPLALRGAWLAGKLGRHGLAYYKRAHEKAQALMRSMDSSLGLLALAARHGALRGEIRKALPREFPEDDTGQNKVLRAINVASQSVLCMACDQPDAYHTTALDYGRRTYLTLSGERSFDAPFEPEELLSVREDLVLPSMALLPYCFVDDPDLTAQLLLMTPYAARAQPESFYFPKADLAAFSRPWELDDSLRLLRAFRDSHQRARPVRAAQTPGRNDPCPCGSSKKYKRCCG